MTPRPIKRTATFAAQTRHEVLECSGAGHKGQPIGTDSACSDSCDCAMSPHPFTARDLPQFGRTVGSIARSRAEVFESLAGHAPRPAEHRKVHGWPTLPAMCHPAVHQGIHPHTRALSQRRAALSHIKAAEAPTVVPIDRAFEFGESWWQPPIKAVQDPRAVSAWPLGCDGCGLSVQLEAAGTRNELAGIDVTIKGGAGGNCKPNCEEGAPCSTKHVQVTIKNSSVPRRDLWITSGSRSRTGGDLHDESWPIELATGKSITLTGRDVDAPTKLGCGQSQAVYAQVSRRNPARDRAIGGGGTRRYSDAFADQLIKIVLVCDKCYPVQGPVLPS